ncbi:MAG: hypothetical protein PHR58_03230, partial [Sphaerochaetaceae bacterium]|nr:hypothetical protein [Sphaerochaetaceae bacterium]
EKICHQMDEKQRNVRVHRINVLYEFKPYAYYRRELSDYRVRFRGRMPVRPADYCCNPEHYMVVHAG